LRAVTTRRSPETYVHASGEDLQRARWRSPFDITPALAGREVLALDVGDRGKLLQIVSPVL
jgi:hypothetical protein